MPPFSRNLPPLLKKEISNFPQIYPLCCPKFSNFGPKMTLNLAQKVLKGARLGLNFSLFPSFSKSQRNPKILLNFWTIPRRQISPQNFHLKFWPRPCTTIANFWLFPKFWPKNLPVSNFRLLTKNSPKSRLTFRDDFPKILKN